MSVDVKENLIAKMKATVAQIMHRVEPASEESTAITSLLDQRAVRSMSAELKANLRSPACRTSSRRASLRQNSGLDRPYVKESNDKNSMSSAGAPLDPGMWACKDKAEKTSFEAVATTLTADAGLGAGLLLSNRSLPLPATCRGARILNLSAASMAPATAEVSKSVTPFSGRAQRRVRKRSTSLPHSIRSTTVQEVTSTSQSPPLPSVCPSPPPEIASADDSRPPLPKLTISRGHGGIAQTKIVFKKLCKGTSGSMQKQLTRRMKRRTRAMKTMEKKMEEPEGEKNDDSSNRRQQRSRRGTASVAPDPPVDAVETVTPVGPVSEVPRLSRSRETFASPNGSVVPAEPVSGDKSPVWHHPPTVRAEFFGRLGCGRCGTRSRRRVTPSWTFQAPMSRALRRYARSACVPQGCRDTIGGGETAGSNLKPNGDVDVVCRLRNAPAATEGWELRAAVTGGDTDSVTEAGIKNNGHEGTRRARRVKRRGGGRRHENPSQAALKQREYRARRRALGDQLQGPWRGKCGPRFQKSAVSTEDSLSFAPALALSPHSASLDSDEVAHLPSVSAPPNGVDAVAPRHPSCVAPPRRRSDRFSAGDDSHKSLSDESSSRRVTRRSRCLALGHLSLSSRRLRQDRSHRLSPGLIVNGRPMRSRKNSAARDSTPELNLLPNNMETKPFVDNETHRAVALERPEPVAHAEGSEVQPEGNTGPASACDSIGGLTAVCAANLVAPSSNPVITANDSVTAAGDWVADAGAEQVSVDETVGIADKFRETVEKKCADRKRGCTQRRAVADRKNKPLAKRRQRLTVARPGCAHPRSRVRPMDPILRLNRFLKTGWEPRRRKEVLPVPEDVNLVCQTVLEVSTDVDGDYTETFAVIDKEANRLYRLTRKNAQLEKLCMQGEEAIDNSGTSDAMHSSGSLLRPLTTEAAMSSQISDTLPARKVLRVRSPEEPHKSVHFEYLGEHGEMVDVIDGFRFASFSSASALACFSRREELRLRLRKHREQRETARLNAIERAGTECGSRKSCVSGSADHDPKDPDWDPYIELSEDDLCGSDVSEVSLPSSESLDVGATTRDVSDPEFDAVGVSESPVSEELPPVSFMPTQHNTDGDCTGGRTCESGSTVRSLRNNRFFGRKRQQSDTPPPFHPTIGNEDATISNGATPSSARLKQIKEPCIPTHGRSRVRHTYEHIKTLARGAFAVPCEVPTQPPCPERDPTLAERLHELASAPIVSEDSGVFSCPELDDYLRDHAPLRVSFNIPGAAAAASVERTGSPPPRVPPLPRPPAARSQVKLRFRTLLERLVWFGYRDEEELDEVRAKQHAAAAERRQRTELNFNSLPLRAVLKPPRLPAMPRVRHMPLVSRAGRLMPLNGVTDRSLAERRAWDNTTNARGAVLYVYDRQKQLLLRGSLPQSHDTDQPYVPCMSRIALPAQMLRPEVVQARVNAWRQKEYHVQTVVVDCGLAKVAASAVCADLMTGAHSDLVPRTRQRTCQSMPHTLRRRMIEQDEEHERNAQDLENEQDQQKEEPVVCQRVEQHERKPEADQNHFSSASQVANTATAIVCTHLEADCNGRKETNRSDLATNNDTLVMPEFPEEVGESDESVVAGKCVVGKPDLEVLGGHSDPCRLVSTTAGDTGAISRRIGISFADDLRPPGRKEVCKSLPSEQSDPCSKDFCRLGCICSSLACAQREPTHCGREECMLNCSCIVWSADSVKRVSALPASTELNPAACSPVTEGRVKRARKAPVRFTKDDVLYNGSLLLAVDDDSPSPSWFRAPPTLPYQLPTDCEDILDWQYAQLARRVAVRVSRYRLQRVRVRPFCLYHQKHGCIEYALGGKCFRLTFFRLTQLGRNVALRSHRLPPTVSRPRCDHSARTFARPKTSSPLESLPQLESCCLADSVYTGAQAPCLPMPPRHEMTVLPLPEPVDILTVTRVVSITPTGPLAAAAHIDPARNRHYAVRLRNGMLSVLSKTPLIPNVTWRIEPVDNVIVTDGVGRRFRNPAEGPGIAPVQVEGELEALWRVPLATVNAQVASGCSRLVTTESGFVLWPKKPRSGVEGQHRLHRVDMWSRKLHDSGMALLRECDSGGLRILGIVESAKEESIWMAEAMRILCELEGGEHPIDEEESRIIRRTLSLFNIKYVSQLGRSALMPRLVMEADVKEDMRSKEADTRDELTLPAFSTTNVTPIALSAPAPASVNQCPKVAASSENRVRLFPPDAGVVDKSGPKNRLPASSKHVRKRTASCDPPRLLLRVENGKLVVITDDGKRLKTQENLEGSSRQLTLQLPRRQLKIAVTGPRAVPKTDASAAPNHLPFEDSASTGQLIDKWATPCRMPTPKTAASNKAGMKIAVAANAEPNASVYESNKAQVTVQVSDRNALKAPVAVTHRASGAITEAAVEASQPAFYAPTQVSDQSTEQSATQSPSSSLFCHGKKTIDVVNVNVAVMPPVTTAVMQTGKQCSQMETLSGQSSNLVETDATLATPLGSDELPSRPGQTPSSMLLLGSKATIASKQSPNIRDAKALEAPYSSNPTGASRFQSGSNQRRASIPSSKGVSLLKTVSLSKVVPTNKAQTGRKDMPTSQSRVGAKGVLAGKAQSTSGRTSTCGPSSAPKVTSAVMCQFESKDAPVGNPASSSEDTDCVGEVTTKATAKPEPASASSKDRSHARKPDLKAPGSIKGPVWGKSFSRKPVSKRVAGVRNLGGGARLSFVRMPPQRVPGRLVKACFDDRTTCWNMVEIEKLPDLMHVDGIRISLTKRYLKHAVHQVKTSGLPVTTNINGVVVTVVWMQHLPEFAFLGPVLDSGSVDLPSTGEQPESTSVSLEKTKSCAEIAKTANSFEAAAVQQQPVRDTGDSQALSASSSLTQPVAAVATAGTSAADDPLALPGLPSASFGSSDLENTSQLGDDDILVLPTPAPRAPLDVILLDNSDISGDELILDNVLPPQPDKKPPKAMLQPIGELQAVDASTSVLSVAASCFSAEAPSLARVVDARKSPAVLSHGTAPSVARVADVQKSPAVLSHGTGAPSPPVGGRQSADLRRPQRVEETGAVGAAEQAVDSPRPKRRKLEHAETPGQHELQDPQPGSTSRQSAGPRSKQYAEARRTLEELLFGRLENAAPVRRKDSLVFQAADVEMDSQRCRQAQLKLRLWQLAQKQRHLLSRLNRLLAELPLEKRIEKIAEIEDLLSFLQVRVEGDDLEPVMMLERKSGQQRSQFRVIAPDSAAGCQQAPPPDTGELSEM